MLHTINISPCVDNDCMHSCHCLHRKPFRAVQGEQQTLTHSYCISGSELHYISSNYTSLIADVPEKLCNAWKHMSISTCLDASLTSLLEAPLTICWQTPMESTLKSTVTEGKHTISRSACKVNTKAAKADAKHPCESSLCGLK